MKQYIVTDGSHSDYHIEAIFLEKDVAEQYKNENNFDRLEEWELQT